MIEKPSAGPYDGPMPERIRCGGKPVTAIVLAGGRGRRMAADKAGLDVGGRTLLELVLDQVGPLFEEILISVSPGQRLPLEPGPAFRVVEDETPGLGPLAGILAGLKAARNDACMVIACDIPEIDRALLEALARTTCGSEITVAVGPSGLYEPLFALYRKSVIPRIEALLASGERSILPLFDRCRTVIVQFDDPGRLRNLNTREDLASYLRTMGGSKGARPHAPAGRGGRTREDKKKN